MYAYLDKINKKFTSYITFVDTFMSTRFRSYSFNILDYLHNVFA